MNIDRMNGRIQRLLDARVSAEEKLKGIPAAIAEIDRRAALPAKDPDHADKLEAQARSSGLLLLKRNLTRRIADIDLSFANLRKHGQERPPTGNPVGVEINVPKGTFKVTEHAPK